jgi:hypothetical protein
MDSVSSSSSRCGGRPAVESSRCTREMKSGCWNCSADTLMETGSSTPRVRQEAAWRTACDSTQSPMAMMKPLSSATGMNSDGDTSPSTGSPQRISASAPVAAPVCRSSCGW